MKNNNNDRNIQSPVLQEDLRIAIQALKELEAHECTFDADFQEYPEFTQEAHAVYSWVTSDYEAPHFVTKVQARDSIAISMDRQGIHTPGNFRGTGYREAFRLGHTPKTLEQPHAMRFDCENPYDRKFAKMQDSKKERRSGKVVLNDVMDAYFDHMLEVEEIRAYEAKRQKQATQHRRQREKFAPVTGRAWKALREIDNAA